MKKIVLAASMSIFFLACNNDNPGTGNRQYQMETRTEKNGDTMSSSAGDTTATTNSSAYNTDSATGQGNRYDSSNRK